MAKPPEDEMMNDLAAADAAGDSELAQHIAGRIKALRAPSVGMGDVQAAPSARAPAAPSDLVPPHPSLRDQAETNWNKGATLRDVWNMVRPGQYAHNAPIPERNPGESDKAYAIRGLHEAMKWNASPEGISNAAALMGYTMPGGAGNPAEAPAQRAPLLRKSLAAQQLEAQGVKGLTVGQMVANPNESALAALEKVTDKSPLGMGRAREAAKESWQRSEVAKSRLPGEPPLPQDPQAAMAEAYNRFGPEYDAVRQHPVSGQTVIGMPDAALQTPGGVPASVKAGAAREIKDALSVLPQPPAPPKPSGLLGPNGQPLPAPPAPPPPNMTAGELIKVRSVIRDAMRTARQQQDFDRLNQLGHAHDVVTQTLEQGLAPEQAAALKDADRRYATLMTVENAPPVGHSDFTPQQLLRSVERSAGKRAFKHGEAGGMQQSAEAAADVFAELPFTGGRPSALAAMPGAKYWGVPLTRLANSDAGKRFLFGQRAPSRFLPPGISGPAAAGARGSFLPLSLGLEPIPVRAEDDRR